MTQLFSGTSVEQSWHSPEQVAAAIALGHHDVNRLPESLVAAIHDAEERRADYQQRTAERLEELDLAEIEL